MFVFLRPAAQQRVRTEARHFSPVDVWLVEERIVPVVHRRAAGGRVDTAPAATERLDRIVEGTLLGGRGRLSI